MRKILGIILSITMIFLYIVPVKAATDINSYHTEVWFKYPSETKHFYQWTGEPVEPEVDVYYERNELTKDVDYTVTYENNVDYSLYAKVIITGIGNYEGQYTRTFYIKKYVTPKIVLSETKIVYDKQEHQPVITGYVGDKKFIDDIFSKSYYPYDEKNGACINVGRYYVSASFVEEWEYYGRNTADYMIIPKGTSIRSLRAGHKTFTVKWKKQRTQTTGYQIKYSRNKNMKNAKKVTVKKNTITQKTIKKLKRKKTYYVKVRTYKLDNKGKKICSSWSKIKRIRVR